MDSLWQYASSSASKTWLHYITLYAVLTVLQGITYGALYGVTMAAVLEAVPREARGVVAGFTQQGFGAGNMIASGLHLAMGKPVFSFAAYGKTKQVTRLRTIRELRMAIPLLRRCRSYPYRNWPANYMPRLLCSHRGHSRERGHRSGAW